MKHPIIFLDIDGVLNSFGDKWPPGEPRPQIELDCVKNFNAIIDATDARIVLSSSWRYLIFNGHLSLLGFGLLLRSHGIHGALVGHTRRDLEDDEERWRQIADWLKEHSGEHGRYCILDDYPDAFGGRPGVRTDNAKGLTAEDAQTAIGLLRGVVYARCSDSVLANSETE